MTQPMPRLAAATIAAAPADVARPRYDRARLRPRIVHLGIGAFVRAHGAIYTDDVLNEAGGDWGIVGVSLQRPDQRDRLVPQNGLYTTLERGAGPPRARIVGCLLDVLVAPEAPAAVVSRLADPQTAIVSLTVTEKGYGHDPASGRLNTAHPDLRHDLEHPMAPRTAIGVITAALALRHAIGQRPFTLLSCDNLSHNGALLRRLVCEFAALRDDRLAAWIERTGAFPSTMVDRIVPATTAADSADAERLTGLADAAPVAHEPFRQWVIEDAFVDGVRPGWEHAGATFAADVLPYETMKLRLLNASHSALAYLGYLGGKETIGDCVADVAYRRYVEALWRDEIIPVTQAPPGVDLSAYARDLLTRYANPAIRHRTWQIAMDGSQKLPQRLLVTVRERLSRGLPVGHLALAVAGWMHYVSGKDLQGNPIDVRDPLSVALGAALAGAGDDPARRVDALLGLREIFGSDLPSNSAWRTSLLGAVMAIGSHGLPRAIAMPS